MIILDTHAWLFWVNDSLDLLSPKAQRAIDSANSLGVNIISCWEIAMLVAKNRLRLTVDIQFWIDHALNYPGIRLVQIDPATAVLSTRLPGHFFGDPADRLIVASCMICQASLVSKDRKIHHWGHINVIW